jgi:predicted metalloprotease
MKSALRHSALALALVVTGSAMTLDAPQGYTNGAPAPVPVRLTERDVEASNAKIAAAYRHLTDTWTDAFDQVGERFAAPRLASYRGNVRTSCGVLPANNAVYCPSRNSIYFDEVFVAAQAKAAAQELGTDGDMTAIGIIAHETGHAVALQLGYRSRFTYDNEKVADCLAGAFARDADRDGALEKGDVEEAFFGMAAAADPDPTLTGNERVDRRIKARAALMGHGTREQRQANFRTGLERGAGACLPQLASVR